MVQIAYYDGGNHAKQEKVEAVLASFPYQCCFLQSDALSQTIGYIMGLDGYTHKESTHSFTNTMELMMLQNLTDEEIQAISMRLREAGVHVPCKAMVTEHNKDWILHDLLTEIAEEHAYFEQYDICKQLILELSTLEERAYTQASWATYQHAIMEGFIMLQEQQPPLSNIMQMIQKIKMTKQALTKNPNS